MRDTVVISNLPKDKIGNATERTYLVNNFPEDLVLIVDAQFLVLNDLIFENKEHDGVVA